MKNFILQSSLVMGLILGSTDAQALLLAPREPGIPLIPSIKTYQRKLVTVWAIHVTGTDAATGAMLYSYISGQDAITGKYFQIEIGSPGYSYFVNLQDFDYRDYVSALKSLVARSSTTYTYGAEKQQVRDIGGSTITLISLQPVYPNYYQSATHDHFDVTLDSGIDLQTLKSTLY